MRDGPSLLDDDDDDFFESAQDEATGVFARFGVAALVLFAVQLVLLAAFVLGLAWGVLWLLQEFGVLTVAVDMGVLLA